MKTRQRIADMLQSFLNFCAELVIPGLIVIAVWAFATLAYGQERKSESIFDQVFVKEPALNFVTVKVFWIPRNRIAEHCGPNAEACGTVGKHDGDLVYIWAQRPNSFSAKETCWLGHELLHSLGGTHR